MTGWLWFALAVTVVLLGHGAIAWSRGRMLGISQQIDEYDPDRSPSLRASARRRVEQAPGTPPVPGATQSHNTQEGTNP